jgi:acylphosphatase
MIARRVLFEGRVQGVGFRYTCKDLARGFDVCGWVRNLPDGRVELQVMGDFGEVTDFIHEIAVESPLAMGIRHHSIEPIPLLEGCSGFAIVA